MSVPPEYQGSSHTLKVSRQGEDKGYPAAIELVLHIPPSPNQHNGFRGIASGSMENSVHVLAAIRFSRGLVLVPLPRNLQS